MAGDRESPRGCSLAHEQRSAAPAPHLELRLKTSRFAAIAISFHGVGNMFRGILAASAFLVKEGGTRVPTCDEFFQINYEEQPQDASARFDKWPEGSVARRLAPRQSWMVI